MDRLRFGFIVILWLEMMASSRAAEPRESIAELAAIEIGTRRELFVDHYLIDKLDGVTLQLHRPQRAGKSLDNDQPWEGAYSGCVTIVNDGDLLRGYYRGHNPDLPGSLADPKKEIICYAESRDGGQSWTKPHLGIYKISGSKENNVILMDKDASGVGSG